MRPFVLIFINLFIFSGFFSKSNSDKKLMLSFTPESTLIIRGKSNIHKFSCNYDTYKLTDSIKVRFEKQEKQMLFQNTKLLLEKTEFDCGGRGINRDFHKLLQTKDFPYITMKLKKVSFSDDHKNQVKTDLSFTICNVTRDYSVPIFISHQKNKMIFKGSISLSISDFDLETPKKVLGLIKVRDTITVDLNLESVFK